MRLIRQACKVRLRIGSPTHTPRYFIEISVILFKIKGSRTLKPSALCAHAHILRFCYMFGFVKLQVELKTVIKYYRWCLMIMVHFLITQRMVCDLMGIHP